MSAPRISPAATVPLRPPTQRAAARSVTARGRATSTAVTGMAMPIRTVLGFSPG